MAYKVVPDRQGVINIGKIKENLVTEVELPAPGFGGGSYAVLLRRPKEEQPYPVTARYEGGSLVWTVQTADTAIAGTGKLECRWYGDNGEVAKSQTYMVRITDGLPDPTEAPEAWEGYIGQVARNAQAAQTAAGEAKANAAGAAASAGIAQGAAAEAGKLAGTAGDAANAAASAASAASSAQAGAETAGQNARAAAEAAETAQSGAEAAKLAAGDRATAAAGSAETAAQAAQKGESLYNQVKDDLAAGKLKGEKGEKGDPGKDAPQIDDGAISRDSPWRSRQIIDTLCPALEESGNPVTCYPVAGYPLGVVASWEPTQAGSGEPYPAGGGPNLLDISRCTAGMTAYGLQTAISGDLLTIQGTADRTMQSASFGVMSTPDTSLSGKGYKITAFPAKGSVTNIYGLRTDTEQDIAVIMPLTEGQVVDVALRVMVSKDTPTAYAPYENIRPISGRDAVSVERCGENLLKIKSLRTSTTNHGCTWTINDDCSITIAGKTGDEASFLGSAVTTLDKSRLQFLPAGTYFFGGKGANVVIYYYGFYSDGTKYSEIIANTTVKIKKGVWITVQGSVIKGKSVNETVYPYIVPGTTAPTAYTPYQGDTLALALPETIYGGSVDAVTGDGTKTWAIANLTDKPLLYVNTHANSANAYVSAFWLWQDISGKNNQRSAKTNIFSVIDWNNAVHFKKPTMWAANTSFGIVFPKADFGLTDESTDAEILAVATKYIQSLPVPLMIAYELAIPTPITATGAQPIPALAGCNTILTDADSVTITGRADPAHAIAALQAQLATATQQLAETQQAIVDTTAMAVDYIYEQDLEDIGLEEVDDSDNQTDTEPVDVPGV